MRNWAYGFATLLIVLSVYLSVQSFIHLDGEYWNIGDDLPRFVMPGEASLTLTEPGTYLIYHEYNSVVGDQIFSNAPSLAGLSVTLTERATDLPLEVNEIRWQEKYAFQQREAIAIWQFELKNPGDYLLSADYVDGNRRDPAVVLTLGRDVHQRSLQTVMQFFWIFLGTVAIGLAGLIVGITTYAIQHKHCIAQTSE